MIVWAYHGNQGLLIVLDIGHRRILVRLGRINPWCFIAFFWTIRVDRSQWAIWTDRGRAFYVWNDGFWLTDLIGIGWMVRIWRLSFFAIWCGDDEASNWAVDHNFCAVAIRCGNVLSWNAYDTCHIAWNDRRNNGFKGMVIVKGCPIWAIGHLTCHPIDGEASCEDHAIRDIVCGFCAIFFDVFDRTGDGFCDLALNLVDLFFRPFWSFWIVWIDRLIWLNGLVGLWIKRRDRIVWSDRLVGVFWSDWNVNLWHSDSNHKVLVISTIGIKAFFSFKAIAYNDITFFYPSGQLVICICSWNYSVRSTKFFRICYEFSLICCITGCYIVDQDIRSLNFNRFFNNRRCISSSNRGAICISCLNNSRIDRSYIVLICRSKGHLSCGWIDGISSHNFICCLSRKRLYRATCFIDQGLITCDRNSRISRGKDRCSCLNLSLFCNGLDIASYRCHSIDMWLILGCNGRTVCICCLNGDGIWCADKGVLWCKGHRSSCWIDAIGSDLISTLKCRGCRYQLISNEEFFLACDRNSRISRGKDRSTCLACTLVVRR